MAKINLDRQKNNKKMHVSDHYSFMYEFFKRIKLHLRRVIDPNSLTFKQQVEEKNDLIGGCRLSWGKFKRDFPDVQLDKVVLQDEL